MMFNDTIPSGTSIIDPGSGIVTLYLFIISNLFTPTMPPYTIKKYGWRFLRLIAKNNMLGCVEKTSSYNKMLFPISKAVKIYREIIRTANQLELSMLSAKKTS